MEPAAIEALKRRNEWTLRALHWSSLIGMAGLVIFVAYRDGSYLELSALVPVAALFLLGQERPGRAPDFWYFWFGKVALVSFCVFFSITEKSWILPILGAVIFIEGVRSWREMAPRKTEVEGSR